MGDFIKDFVNAISAPVPYFFGGVIIIALVLKFRRISTKPILITAFFVLGTAFFLWAWKDPNFNKIVTKPDNVPILMLLASVVYFSWLSLRRGYLNDERTKAGKPTLEGELSKQKVFTWPDLVYTEFICMLLFTACLMVWSISIEAPIEDPRQPLGDAALTELLGASFHSVRPVLPSRAMLCPLDLPALCSDRQMSSTSSSL